MVAHCRLVDSIFGLTFLPPSQSLDTTCRLCPVPISSRIASALQVGGFNIFPFRRKPAVLVSVLVTTEAVWGAPVTTTGVSMALT